MTSPEVAVKLPRMVEAPRSKAVMPLSIVTCPVLPPAVRVLNVTAPVKALVLFKVIALSLTSVVKLDVPLTVVLPLSVMTSPEVTARVPAMLEVPKFKAVVPLSKMTLPAPPWVVKLTAPVRALEPLFMVMVLLLTSVVKLEVPATVRAPVWVMVPPVVALRLPLMVEAARIRLVVLLSMVT